MFAEANAPLLTPISATGRKLGSISITKIQSTMTSDAKIGRNRQKETKTIWLPGLDPISSTKKREKDYSANEIFNEQIVQQYLRIMNDEMKKAGYPIETANSLFEESNPKNTDFMLGAIILKCNVRNVVKPIKKDYVQVHFEEIEWQVYNTQKKEVVLKIKTNGYSQRRGSSVYEPALQAFERAFRNFLAQEVTVKAFEK